MTLQELTEHFFRLYGRRNRIFLSGLGLRTRFLNLAIGDLQHAIRKGYDINRLRIALARVFSRVCCIAENFSNLPFIDALTRKYPAEHCSYCQKLPCGCERRREEAKLRSEGDPTQLRWTLKEWCWHFNAVYGQRNGSVGIEQLLNRLFREVCEFQSLEMRIDALPGTLEGIEFSLALELADAFAWTCAIANYFSVDLELAVLERYGIRCWKCRKPCCECGRFNLEPVDWGKVSVHGGKVRQRHRRTGR